MMAPMIIAQTVAIMVRVWVILSIQYSAMTVIKIPNLLNTVNIGRLIF